MGRPVLTGLHWPKTMCITVYNIYILYYIILYIILYYIILYIYYIYYIYIYYICIYIYYIIYKLATRLNDPLPSLRMCHHIVCATMEGKSTYGHVSIFHDPSTQK